MIRALLILLYIILMYQRTPTTICRRRHRCQQETRKIGNLQKTQGRRFSVWDLGEANGRRGSPRKFSVICGDGSVDCRSVILKTAVRPIRGVGRDQRMGQPCFSAELLWGGYSDRLTLSLCLANRVPERLPHGREMDLHNIAVLQAHTLSKTEGVSTKEVDVYIPRP